MHASLILLKVSSGANSSRPISFASGAKIYIEIFVYGELHAPDAMQEMMRCKVFLCF